MFVGVLLRKLLFPKYKGARGSVVVKGLCCKPEGRGSWVPMRWIFSIDLILPAALALGSTQPLTQLSTRNF
jgi:hypothetical protein